MVVLRSQRSSESRTRTVRHNIWTRRLYSADGRMAGPTLFMLTFVLLGLNVLCGLCFRRLELRKEMRTARNYRREMKRVLNICALLDEDDCEYIGGLSVAAAPVDPQCGQCVKTDRISRLNATGNHRMQKKVCLDRDAYCNWRFIGSAYFSFTLFTTIGFGDFTPQTDGGKITAVACTTFGMIIAFALFTAIGERIYETSRVYCRVVERWPASVFVMMFAVYILSGGSYFHKLDLLQGAGGLGDATYFCFTAVSTLGLGDMLPKMENLPLASTYFYSIFGIALASAAIHAVTDASELVDIESVQNTLPSVSGHLLSPPRPTRPDPDDADADDATSRPKAVTLEMPAQET